MGLVYYYHTNTSIICIYRHLATQLCHIANVVSNENIPNFYSHICKCSTHLLYLLAHNDGAEGAGTCRRL